jgi:DNA-binding transcriptional LysR family regulator
VSELAKLDWNDLRYFLAALRAGTLAGAARALGVKHSTVRRRLTALERALGANVVIRSEHGLLLTPLGDKLVPYAEAVERSAGELEREAKSQSARVRVAIPTGLVKLFAPHLAEFRRKHPSISIEFLSSSTRVDLHKGEAELAVRMGAIEDDSLVARKIGELEWSLYASSSYLARHAESIDPRNLSSHEVLGFDARLSGVPGAKWMAAHSAGATIVLVNRDMADLVAAAVVGLGLAVLPCIVAEGEPELRRVTQEELGRHILSVAYSRQTAVTKSVSLVIQFVTGVLRTWLRPAPRESI